MRSLSLLFSFLFLLSANSYATHISAVEKVSQNEQKVLRNDSDNFDIILLMDSSGSMKTTDPKNYRKPAAKLFISLLGAEDRIGIISFGESAKVLIPLTHNTEKNRESLFNNIDRIASKEFSTNITEAVKKGFEELRSSRRMNRIIILMSDGKLTLGSREDDNAAYKELLRFIPELKNSGIKIYSIAFTELADMKLLCDLAEKTRGFSNLAKEDTDIHLIFAAIFEKIKSPDMLPLEGDAFHIDKDVDETILLISKTQGTRITIVDPSAEREYCSTRYAKNMLWYESKVFDMITIKKPDVGKWRIKLSTTEGNRIFVITDLKLRSSFNANFTNKGEELKIDSWLERRDNMLRDKEILEQMTFEAEVTGPDNKVTRLHLIDNGTSGDRSANDGVYSAEFTADGIGDYSLKINANGKTFKREKIFRFKVVTFPPAKTPEQGMTEMQTSEVIPKREEIVWKSVLVKFGIINLILLISIFITHRTSKFLIRKGRKGK